MSTTSKVLKKLYHVLGEKSEGITVSEFWEYLFEDKELAKELVFDGNVEKVLLLDYKLVLKKVVRQLKELKLLRM